MSNVKITVDVLCLMVATALDSAKIKFRKKFVDLDTPLVNRQNGETTSARQLIRELYESTSESEVLTMLGLTKGNQSGVTRNGEVAKQTIPQVVTSMTCSIVAAALDRTVTKGRKVDPETKAEEDRLSRESAADRIARNQAAIAAVLAKLAEKQTAESAS